MTGGAGFLGSHLCERLLHEGYSVLCLDDFSTGSPANVAHLAEIGPFRLVRADVTDFVHVVGDVDAVLHFASPASPIDYLRMPIETLKVGSIGTLHALGLAKEKGARFLLASTSEAYGDPQVHPQPETLLGPRQPGRAARGVRRGEAVRRGDDDGLPAHARRRHRDRADLQHVRPADAPRRRAGHPDVHPAGAARRADHGGRRRQPDPLDPLRRRPGRGHASGCCTRSTPGRSTSATRTRCR